jgi:predicted dehydrogenase/nucleoside-diphosphate-sugar epimerase
LLWKRFEQVELRPAHSDKIPYLKMIFLTGATGFIGTNLTQKLVINGYATTCLVRRTSDVSNLKGLGVNLAFGDITDRESIERAIGDSRVIIHLAGTTSEVSSDLDLSRKVNVQGTKNLLDVARKFAIQRFIHLTSESTKRTIKGAYAQTKFEADELIRASGLGYTILRPSIVYGPGGRGLFRKTIGYIDSLPFIPIVGSGRQRIKPIFLDDVTDLLVACLKSEVALHKEYDLTGADEIDFEEFIDQILQELDVKKKKIHIPFWLVYAATKIVSAFMKNPPVTIDNLLGLKQQVEMDITPAQRDFGFQPLTFREGLRRTFYGLPSSAGKKIAVVGMGKMGLLHSSLIKQIKNAELVAVCDTNPKIKKQFQSLGIRVPFFSSIEGLIKKTTLDAVFICTPPHVNYELSKKFIDQNISVFVEKPLSDNLATAKRMVDLAEAKGVSTSCGYMLAYSPVFQELKKIVDGGSYGRVLGFDSCCYISQVFKKRSPKGNWRYDPGQTGGGVLMTMASHLVFILNGLFGKLVKAETTIRKIYTVMDDEVRANLFFGNDVAGSLQASWSIKGYEDLYLGLTLSMEKARIKATNKLLTVEELGKRKEIHISSLRDPATFELGGPGYFEQDADFVNSLSNGQALTNWANALETQEAMDLIYRGT